MVIRWEADLSDLSRVAFDTNALVYLLNGREPYASYVAQTIGLMDGGELVGIISTVVEMELLVKPLRDRDVDMRDRAEFLLRTRPYLMVRSVDRLVARRAAAVRARSRLSAIDAIIVATALEEQCDAIIGNDSLIARRVTDIPYLYLGDYV